MRPWTIAWPVILVVLYFLAQYGAWDWFYFLATGSTVAHALFPVEIRRGRRLAIGAGIMFASYICSVWFLEIMSYDAALIPHSITNTVATLGFLVITLFNRSFWSAICTALHAGMVVLAYLYFTREGISLYDFQQWLNGMYLAALAIINIARYAGRREWGESFDVRLARLTGFTFTGLRPLRIHSDRAAD